MLSPLAPPGEGFHFARVRRPFLIAALALVAAPALAQVDDGPVDGYEPGPDAPVIITPPDIGSIDDLLDQLERTPPEAGVDTPRLPDPDAVPDAPPLPPEPQEDEEAAEDYSRLSFAEERRARLDGLFERLQGADGEAQAKLVAEEIWALWARSGSASADFVLRRAATAQARSDFARARALYDTVTELEPGFAEGWARSGRLALDERDFSRAVGDSIRALRIEPRHYYALWTLASVLERMGRLEEALDAYQEAASLYPELSEVTERVKALEAQLGGGVL